MLINCSKCNKEVSHKTQSCPNCGNPISEITDPTLTKEIPASKYQYFAVIAFVVALFTPKIIATLPILATLILSVISLSKKERWPIVAWSLIFVTFYILFR